MPEAEKQLTEYDGRAGTLRPLRPSNAVRPVRAKESLIPWPAVTSELVSSVQPAVDEPQIAEFVRLVLAENDSGVRSFVDHMMSTGTSVQSIYLDLLAPTARALGAMWEADSCDFVDVTMGVARLQLVLRDLSQMFVRDRPEEDVAGRVLLTCVPGEQHSLGLFMVAEFFIRDGWEVHVGPPLSLAALLADVGREWYDILGFSVSCESRYDVLKRDIRRVRDASLNPAVLIMVGGRAFNDNPALMMRVGADATAQNAELAPERARQLLAQS